MDERSNESARVFCTLRVKHDPTALAESAWENAALQEGIRALAALAVDKTDDVSRCTWVHGTVLRAVSQTEWHTPGTLGIVMNTEMGDARRSSFGARKRPLAPSSKRLGRHPFKVRIRVQLPVGSFALRNGEHA